MRKARRRSRSAVSGQAPTASLIVVDVLTTNNFVTVTRIATSRGDVDEARRVNVTRLHVVVVKSSQFDALYTKEKKKREQRREQVKTERATKCKKERKLPVDVSKFPSRQGG